MIIPFPACFYQPDPEPCFLAISSCCSNCCTGTDILLGYLVLFLNLLLISIFAVGMVFIAYVLAELAIAAKAKWKLKRLQKEENNRGV